MENLKARKCEKLLFLFLFLWSRFPPTKSNRSHYQKNLMHSWYIGAHWRKNPCIDSTAPPFAQISLLDSSLLNALFTFKSPHLQGRLTKQQVKLFLRRILSTLFVNSCMPILNGSQNSPWSYFIRLASRNCNKKANRRIAGTTEKVATADSSHPFKNQLPKNESVKFFYQMLEVQN